MDGAGLVASLEPLLDDSHHQSGHVSDLWESFDFFSYPAILDDSGQNQSNSGLRETLLNNNLPSPRHGSVLLSPLRQEFNATRTGLRRQLSSTTPDVSAAQVVNANEATLLDMNLDFDFSSFESPPHGPSAARSASFHADPNPRISGEIMSISPFQLADDGTRSEDRNFNLVPGSTTAEGQALGRVTAQDVRAESIASLLMMLKSYVLPSFDIASQKYEYGTSIITEVFGPHLCEWFCSEFEALLDSYLEKTLMSNRKRRAARVLGHLPLGPNVYVNEPEQDLELTLGTQRCSNTTEGGVAKLRSAFFYRCCWTPMGLVIFEVRKVSGHPIEEGEPLQDFQIIIKMMPRAMERTLGLCAHFTRLVNKPGISPHINTFNVVPDNSAIFECIRRNDLKGVQTLFDQGAASARDVDPRGRSLLNVGVMRK